MRLVVPKSTSNSQLSESQVLCSISASGEDSGIAIATGLPEMFHADLKTADWLLKAIDYVESRSIPERTTSQNASIYPDIEPLQQFSSYDMNDNFVIGIPIHGIRDRDVIIISRPFQFEDQIVEGYQGPSDVTHPHCSVKRLQWLHPLRRELQIESADCRFTISWAIP
jgi:hypothetical protein